MKNWIIAAAGVLVVVVLIVVFLVIPRSGTNDGDFYIYHFNPTARRLEAEARHIPPGEPLIETLVGFMNSEPLSSTLVTTWPLELAPAVEDLIQAVILEDSMLLAFFDPIFNDMTPLNQNLFKAAFVHTMESLVERAFPYVSDTMILVTDDYRYAYETLMLSLFAEEYEEAPDVPWLIYDGTIGIYNDPFLSRASITPHTFNHLHFVDETGTGLIVETHVSDEVDHDVEERARYALLLLINGLTPEGAIFPIPPETVIHTVILDIDLSAVFIDFSSDFMTRFVGDSNLARLMIYSIVNTLTGDFTAITRVHFMIDAQQHETFHGVPNFDQPFVRDETLLLSYIQEREEERERQHREEWLELE